MFELTLNHPLWLYAVLVFGIIVLPGMDMAFVLGSTLAGGLRSGAAALAGIVAGGVAHTAMSGLGLGLVLLSAPRLFNVLLVAGALYVAWMGWALLRAAPEAVETAEVATQPPRQAAATFGLALLTCLLNPKAYVFMLAVFPQFLRAEAGALGGQLLRLGGITALAQVLVYGAVVLAASRLRGWLSSSAKAQRGMYRLVGASLLAMAAWTAVQGWRG